MSRFRDPGFIFELGFVFAIYFAFIFVYLLFSGILTVVLAEYLAIAILVSVTVFMFYRAYMRRQIFAFFIGFTVIGLLLFSLSTVVALPYTAIEPYAYTSRGNFYNNTITLGPYESQNISTYSLRAVSLLANGTVVQLRFSNTKPVWIRLYYRTFSEERLGLEHRHGAWENEEIGEEWHYIYWAPVGPINVGGLGMNTQDDRADDKWTYWIRIGLENREDAEAQVHLEVDYYDFLATSTRFVTKYHSAIDPYFGYFGVGLIVAAVIIEFWAWPGKKLRSSKTPVDKH